MRQAIVLLLLLPTRLLAEPLEIPAGPFWMGSTPQERELGYALDEARGSTAARSYRWFDNETRQQIKLPAYRIDRTQVTQSQFRRFVQETSYPAPSVDRKTWEGYRLIHPFSRAQKYNWQDGQPPAGKQDHPVVLVDARAAEAYCAWAGGSLPSEAQWEKAARGTDGRIFPWGDTFDPQRLNSADAGPYATEPVGSRPAGASPYGVLNMAGQVFEWTATQCPGDASRRIVKGGSWDDYPGVTRAAARHCRPLELKHILIGFRCAYPAKRSETSAPGSRSSGAGSN